MKPNAIRYHVNGKELRVETLFRTKTITAQLTAKEMPVASTVVPRPMGLSSPLLFIYYMNFCAALLRLHHRKSRIPSLVECLEAGRVRLSGNGTS